MPGFIIRFPIFEGVDDVFLSFVEVDEHNDENSDNWIDSCGKIKCTRGITNEKDKCTKGVTN